MKRYSVNQEREFNIYQNLNIRMIIEKILEGTNCRLIAFKKYKDRSVYTLNLRGVIKKLRIFYCGYRVQLREFKEYIDNNFKKDLNILYSNWRKEIEDIRMQFGIVYKTSYKLKSVRKDFSEYIDFNGVISYELMSKLENTYEEGFLYE